MSLILNSWKYLPRLIIGRSKNRRFHVIYKLYSIEKSLRIGLRVPVPGIEPSLPTLVDLYSKCKLARTGNLGYVRNSI